MKIILLFAALVNCAYSYDGVIRDEFGRVQAIWMKIMAKHILSINMASVDFILNQMETSKTSMAEKLVRSNIANRRKMIDCNFIYQL